MKGQRRKKHLFRKKKGQLEDQAYSKSSDSRNFYRHLNDTRKPFEPAVPMCRATNGQLLTNNNNDQVLSRWKEYFEQHLNECSEEDPHARENDVIIDLPSWDEIVEARKNMKDNKAAGLDSIAAELLKGGRSSMANPIQRDDPASLDQRDTT
jgi:hypothetical protein